MAEQFGLDAKGDTMIFKGWHRADFECDAEHRSMFEVYTKNDVNLEFQLFWMLLPMLTDPEMELPLAQHTTKMYLEPAFKFDDVLACQLLEQMQQVIDEAVDKTNLTPKQLGSSVEIIDIINEALPDGEKCPMKWNQPKPGKKRKRIPALAKDDEGMKQLLAHGTEAVRNIALARQAVKSWPKELCRIEKMLALSDAAGGMLLMLRVVCFLYLQSIVVPTPDAGRARVVSTCSIWVAMAVVVRLITRCLVR
jgi:hypothetical protein